MSGGKHRHFNTHLCRHTRWYSTHINVRLGWSSLYKRFFTFVHMTSRKTTWGFDHNADRTGQHTWRMGFKMVSIKVFHLSIPKSPQQSSFCIGFAHTWRRPFSDFSSPRSSHVRTSPPAEIELSGYILLSRQGTLEEHCESHPSKDTILLQMLLFNLISCLYIQSWTIVKNVWYIYDHQQTIWT